MILAIRTDKPEAELYLFQGTKEIKKDTWYAHRELSDTLLGRIESLLHGCNANIADLKGIIVCQGPGSFTGLRIGVTVANTLAYALAVPIAAGRGDEWAANALDNLAKTPSTQIILPHYGSEVHITKPRK